MKKKWNIFLTHFDAFSLTYVIIFSFLLFIHIYIKLLKNNIVPLYVKNYKFDIISVYEYTSRIIIQCIETYDIISHSVINCHSVLVILIYEIKFSF